MDPPTDNAFRRIIDHPMEHLRVLGPAGSGKTRLVCARYQALAAALGDDGGAHILTYSRESLRRISEQVLRERSCHTGLSPVISHFTLSQTVINASGQRPPRIIGDIEERLLLQKTIERRRRAFRSDFVAIIDSEGFQRNLLSVFHLLLQHHVVGDEVERLAAFARQARFVDLVELYRHFTATLREKRLATYYDIAWHAVECCEGVNPLPEARVLLVDDFQDVDAGQFALLRRVAPPEGAVAVNVFGDAMGACFDFRGTDDRWLLEEFPRLYACPTMRLPGASPFAGAMGNTLGRLLDETLGDEAKAYLPLAAAAPSIVETAAGARAPRGRGTEFVSMTVAHDEVEEVYRAAERAHRLVTAQAVAPNEIAVITNQKRAYEPLVKMAFRQWGVPLDSGRATENAFGNFASSLLRMVHADEDDIAERAVLTSLFFRDLAAACRSTRAGAPDDRDTPAAKRPKADDRRDERDLRRVIVELRGQLADGNAGDWMRHFVRACLLPVCRAHVEAGGDDGVFSSLSSLIERWDEYIDALATTGDRVHIGTFLRTSGRLSDGVSQPQPSRRHVGFYSCREAKGLSFRCVLVLGCSELLFPSVKRRESAISPQSLQSLLDTAFPDRRIRVYDAKTPEQHLSEEYHLLYLTLSRALDELHIFAPEQFAGQDHPAPTAVLRDSRVPAPAGTDERVPPPTRFARAWTAGSGSLPGARDLASLSRIAALWGESAVAPQPFNVARFALSKSSIQNYVTCTRRFFYEKILRVRDEDSPAITLGNLYHVVMASIGGAFPTKARLHGEISEEFIRSRIDEAIRDNPNVIANTFVGRALRFHLERMVSRTLRLDQDVFDDYTVTAAERMLDFAWREQPFRGKLDRIETTAGGGVILVDYKSGDVARTAVTHRERVLSALSAPEKADWQVPLYVWGYRQNEGVLPGVFRFVNAPPDGDALHITLYIRERENDVPRSATSNRRDDKRYSYLLESEVERIMNAAVEVAESVFATRNVFARTVDTDTCRNCSFKRLCRRENA